ncbi:5' exonuclease Apollo [Periophthalmus magnuspinnatus]|uniref:5' exonuclease Apollo n=1 Tax=Periophthalmus magnuspinnatus TaxID=409849 RepID=A0A3B4AJX8_9GOBI|nr:5' exonuclease Apollo [Periophthalmus magnuspinnatus]
MNGKVIPHTPLAVDFWQVRKCPETRLFFLSHMHSDHTVGLSSTWNNRPIYCSPVTATLLQLKLKVKEQWIHPLELGEPYLLPLDDIGKEMMTVTLINANHCPGAVMFLFEGYFGSILYTGDFRYTPSMLREPGLRTNTTIDVLYLDNTNCDPNRTLPSRKTATQQIKEIIRSHPNHNVVIGLYTLGKESLLVELALEFKSWVEVSVGRMETLKALELPDVFTTERGAGRFRVVDQSQISHTSMLQFNNEQPTLAILPTSRPLVSFHPNVHIVPYSDHSSYQELEDFVSAIKPRSIVSILGRCVPGGLSALLPNRKHHEFLVPESVRIYMSRHSNNIDNQVSTSGYNNFHRKLLPLPPKGVIFESPEKGDGGWQSESTHLSEEEDMDTDTIDKDDDSLVIDLSKQYSYNNNKRRDVDLWSLNIVQTVSEEVAVAESVPFSQFSQGNFGPVEILTSPKVSLKPSSKTRRACETSDNLINEEMDRDQQYGDGIDNRSQPPDRERTSQQNDNDLMSGDTSPSQHNGSDFEPVNSEKTMQKCYDNVFCIPNNKKVFKHQYLEELEDALLKNLPFSEEDLTCLPLFEPHLLQIFTHSHSYTVGSTCAST